MTKAENAAELLAAHARRPRNMDDLLMALVSQTSGDALQALAAAGVTQEGLQEVLDGIGE